MKILIAVPTFENIYPDVFKSIYDLDPAGHQLVFNFIRGYDCAMARNRIAQLALNERVDYVLMVDNDVTLPSNAITCLTEDSKDVVLGLYACRDTNGRYNGEACVYVDGEFDYVTKFKMEKINELLNEGKTKVKIHGGGMGCAFIKTEVFNKTNFPWFRFVTYNKTSCLSEDLYFCEECKKHGIEIYMDVRVRCGHMFRYVQQLE